MNISIKSFLKNYRNWKTKLIIFNSLLRFLIFLIPIITLIILSESIFYHSITIRTHILQYTIASICFCMIYLILKWLINSNQLFGNLTNTLLAKEIGFSNPNIKDRLLNALQLDIKLQKQKEDSELAEAAIEKIKSDINLISHKSIFDTINSTLKFQFIIVISMFVAIYAFNFNSSNHAIQRLVNPNTYFEPPKPFNLTSLSKHVEILGGDSVSVSVAGFGNLPDSLSIRWMVNKQENQSTMYKNKEIYTFTFPNVNQDIIWYSEYINHDFFSAWNQINTRPDTIFVTDRPVIESVDFTIIPPSYTGEQIKNQSGSITNLQILSGSKLRIKAKANKPLKKAWVDFYGNESKELNINNLFLEETFVISESVTLSLFCTDINDVGNIAPTQYRLNVYNDLPPEILITSPEYEFELDESNKILITFQTNDDYGFSSAWINYKQVSPDYLTQKDTSFYKYRLADLLTSVRSQQLIHNWDISALNLEPEDEIHFTISVADNNSLSGPSVTRTKLIKGRYPTLEDMFNQLEQNEQKIENYSDEMISDVEDIQDLVESLQLEMLKSDEMSWEQQQKAEEAIEQMNQVFNQLEEMEELVEKIQDQAEKNNLVSDQLTEKFDKFQELLESIITPELMAAMEKMQEAMQNMDMQEMLNSLNEFDYDLEEFEEQLDRFIDMFEQAIAEQKMDEIIKRLEQLSNDQELINNDLTSNQNINFQNLASKERRQEEQFKKLEGVMEEAKKVMKDISTETSKKIDDLMNSSLTKQAKKEIESARKNMQDKNQSESEKSALIAKNKIDEMLKISQEIQKQFQENTVGEMMDLFLSVIRNVLYISQSQEQLVIFTDKLNSRNPRLPTAALKQNQIKRQNLQLMNQMLELSKKTFYISPAISRSLGKTTVAMDRAIGELEQKQAVKSKNLQKEALNGLNETAYLLMQSMEEMQSSGSASGFESYMAQLEQMSEQQKGVNKGTMQMGQMGMMAQQQMMEGLQSQQEALQKALQEMLSEMPGGDIPGGLSKAEKDMEEVINDFKRNQVNRQTVERQQQILSRMLDSQKSMTQREIFLKRGKAKLEMSFYMMDQQDYQQIKDKEIYF